MTGDMVTAVRVYMIMRREIHVLMPLIAVLSACAGRRWTLSVAGEASVRDCAACDCAHRADQDGPACGGCRDAV